MQATGADEPGDPCPVEVTLAVIGGKWKAVLVFYMNRGGAQRFAELRRKTTGISERVLTRQLRELEADGIVHREVFPEVPARVEYSLTEYGRSLGPVTEAMCQWGKKHMATGAAWPRSASMPTSSAASR